MTASHTRYGPGELLKATSGLYTRPKDPRFDILIDVARLLHTDSCRTKDHLRILCADKATYLVEEKRGEHYEVVFRASYGEGLTFFENKDGGWRNALQRWYDAEFPSNTQPL